MEWLEKISSDTQTLQPWVLFTTSSGMGSSLWGQKYHLITINFNRGHSGHIQTHTETFLPNFPWFRLHPCWGGKFSAAPRNLTEGERDRFTLRDQICFSSFLHPNLQRARTEELTLQPLRLPVRSNYVLFSTDVTSAHISVSWRDWKENK